MRAGFWFHHILKVWQMCEGVDRWQRENSTAFSILDVSLQKWHVALKRTTILRLNQIVIIQNFALTLGNYLRYTYRQTNPHRAHYPE